MLSSVTSRRICGSGVPVLISATMRWRVRRSISGSCGEQLAALVGVGHVTGDGRAQQCARSCAAVGQRRIGANGDALHALRAVFGNVERGFAAGDVLGCGVAGGGGDHAHGGQRRGWLVIAEVERNSASKLATLAKRRALGLAGGQRVGTAAASAGASEAATASRIGSRAWPRRLE
jgi:hypothetical protein